MPKEYDLSPYSFLEIGFQTSSIFVLIKSLDGADFEKSGPSVRLNFII
jgi:hypothetical protein